MNKKGLGGPLSTNLVKSPGSWRTARGEFIQAFQSWSLNENQKNLYISLLECNSKFQKLVSKMEEERWENDKSIL